MNRVNEFADAFSGWMKEYAEKQQVSCGGKEYLERAEPTVAGITQALAEHNKQMDKPLRVVSDMVKEKE